MRVRVANQAISKSLVLAVEPDNLRMGGLNVAGTATRSAATFRLAYEGRVETFIFTLDDLLRCVQAAKGTLDNITGKKLE